MSPQEREQKRRAGRAGGLATLAKHGAGHMAKIGRLGAAELYRRYRLVPAGVAGWALVNRQTGEVRAVWS